MTRTIVGEAFIQILPIDGGVTPGVQKIIDNLPKGVNVPVTADTEQASKNVTGLAAQIEGQIGGAWQSAAVQAAGFTAAVLGVRAAVEGAVNQLAGLFDQLAQAQAGFTAILGSQSAGQQLLDDIREFARVSPFVTQELVNYSQQLLGVGQSAESIIPLLKSTGDLIASVGGDTQNISRVLFTLTQIRSIGRLVGQDAIQLQSALVPITKLLADFLGKTTAEVKKLQEQGAISADTVFAAITNAGSKVEGAMNTATRNISGARSVLSDTVKIMLQDSQSLNVVFDDLVKGILDFSNALGSNENLQRDIDSIDESLSSLYESLQPLLDGLSDTTAAVALNSLSILASSLEILASALNAIPEGALKVLGQGLAILFALKTPLFLIRYVQSIAELGRVLRPENAKKLVDHALGIAATGIAAERATPALGRFNAALNNHLTTISSIAIGAGLLVSSLNQENDALQNLGGALTGAGFGAQLGAAFGPQGAIIGLAAGAGIGFVTSFVSNAREEAARRQGEIAEIGERAAKKFLEGFTQSTGPIDTTQDISKFFEQTTDLRKTVDTYDKLIAARKELQAVLDSDRFNPQAQLLNQQAFNELQTVEASLDQVNKKIEETGETAATARAQLDSLFSEGAFADAVNGLATKTAQLSKESETFVEKMKEFANTKFPQQPGLFSSDFSDELARTQAIAVLLGDTVIDSADDLTIFNEAARGFGLSVDEFISLPLETLVDITSNKIPSALSTARLEVGKLRTAFEEAKKATDEFFKPFIDQINTAQATLQAEQGLSRAFEAFIPDRSEANALALGEAYAKVAQQIAAINEAAFQGSGQEAGVSFLIAQLDSLKEELGLTDAAFEDLLRQMGLLSLYKTGIDPGFTGSVAELAEQLGVSQEALERIIPSLDDIPEGKQITITTNILEKVEELRILTNGFTDFSTVGPAAAQALQDAFQNIDILGGLTPQLNELEARLKGLREEIDIETRRALSPGRPTQVQNQRNAEAIRQDKEKKRLAEIARKAQEEAERLAEEARREAERLAREQERLQREAEQAAEEARREAARIAQAYKDSNEALQEALLRASQQIEDAAKGWTASIKDRVQPEQAVSVTRLIRNASDQASGLDELNRGIQALQARGLSTGAQEALGIDNIADLRQVRRLLQASGGDLAQLSSLVALRDSNAEAIARRERQQETQATIVAAIIQAAGILGFEITPERAAAIAMSIQITGDPSSALLPTGIIEQIQNAGVLLRT